MEPLRLLQFWHIPSGKNPAAVRDSPFDITLTSTTTTTNKDKEGRHAIEETDDEDSFFDLDFTVPLKKNLSKQHDDVLPRKLLPNPHSPPPPKLRLHMLLKNPDADEEVQIFSVLNSIGNSTPTTTKLHKQRRFPKVVIQKYLKLINPFYYSRASKRYTDQTDEISKTTPFSSPRKQVQQQGIRVGTVAGNHLGKSRSTSSAVRAAPARRDDSLLLQDDGIQSAILHCKRSYNSSSGFYVLSRSARSEPSDEVSVNNRCRNSREDVKTRNSI
ncbi:hypothetical protein Vadar_029932 [Vaccinium darrowii]|uniref:Uncharacterized protein n=1 Tax=Vaccinium darrowii TaxID=229202 RepID=A0ACB7XM36_9ERIC|nr:hypothetical protein Vadar_029932 [Vaccinium darrowii]